MGSIAGAVVGIVPGLSPSQAGLIMAGLLGNSVRNFLVAVSAINTADAIYSLVAVYTIGNPRSGVAVMVSKIVEVNWSTLLLFTGVIAVTGLFATLMHLWIGKRARGLFGKVNYRLVGVLTILFIVVLVYVFTGWVGLYITALATVVGLLPILAGVSRTHSMGVLIIPTILYFIGL